MTDDLYERYKATLRAGHVALLRGSLPQAADAYRAAAAIAPSRALPHTSLGGVLMRLGQTDEALAEYAHAVALAPGDEGALLGEAEALSAAGKKAEAALALDRVAEVQEASGRLPEAADTLRRALELEDMPERVQHHRSMLRRIRLSDGDQAAEQLLAKALRLRDEPTGPGRQRPMVSEAVAAEISRLAEAPARAAAGALSQPAETDTSAEAAAGPGPATVADTAAPALVASVEAESPAWTVEDENVAAEAQVEPADASPALPAESVPAEPAPAATLPGGAPRFDAGADEGDESLVGDTAALDAGTFAEALALRDSVQAEFSPDGLTGAEESELPGAEVVAEVAGAARVEAAESAPEGVAVEPAVAEAAAPEPAGPEADSFALPDEAEPPVVAVMEKAPERSGHAGTEVQRQPTGDELLAAAEAADASGDQKALRSLLVWTARAYAREGRFEAALDAAHRLLRANPADVDAHLVLVELYVARDWDALAVEKLSLLDKLAKLGEDAPTHERLRAVTSRAFPSDPRLESILGD